MSYPDQQPVGEVWDSTPAQCGACGRDALDPCRECALLLMSDAFSGVDARHDVDYEHPETPQPDEDFYEWRNEKP